MLWSIRRLFRNLLGLSNFQDPYIFHYYDGTRKRSADPIAIELSLIESLGEDWQDQVTSLSKPIPFGAVGEAAEKLKTNRETLRKRVLNAIDVAFDVCAYSDNGGQGKAFGLIDPMRFGLLNGYLLFCVDLVRLSRPFGNAQSRASPIPESQPMLSGQDSTSPEKVSVSDGPII